jgi:Xaa-Pro aminopeptidase
VDHGLRRDALADRLAAIGVDAIVLTHLPNVRYLTGFTGSNAQLLLGTGGGVFFTDGRYTEQSRHEVPDLPRVTTRSLGTPLREHCERLGIARLGFEAERVSVAQHVRIASDLDGVVLVPTEPHVERLRWMKDDEERGLLRAAQEATDRAFEDILDVLAIGMQERQVAIELEQALRRAGADGMAFEPIVAFGEHAAEPHHEPGHRVLGEGDVIKLDFGALVGGYHADMTRTIAFGEPPPELRKIHDVVREAQHAGIDAVRPGIPAVEVDAAARGVVRDAGYGEAFSHGLGHGVGLEIHEGPALSADSEDVLPERAVVTIEPGIYVPGLGGVRIEDMVEVTADGCRVLGSSTRELIEL